MANIITQNGVFSYVTPKNNRDFSLKELQEVVEGFIEIVRREDNHIMVVNEEGLLLNLQYNERASMIAKQPIFGRVLVCKDYEVK